MTAITSLLPNRKPLLVSDFVEEARHMIDFARSGQMRGRQFRSTVYYSFTAVYALTLAEYKTLRAAYQATPLDEYTGFEYWSESPQRTYTVQMTGPATLSKHYKKELHLVNVFLRGTVT